MRLSYVLPVHNEEQTLPVNVPRLVARLRDIPHSEILLVENGSLDRSWEIAQSLAGDRDGVRVRAYREPVAGIGHGYHRGLVEAVASVDLPTERWAILTAVDLPFGFTDLEQAILVAARPGSPRVLIGSKAHPASKIDVTKGRGLSSWVYRQARRGIAGMRAADSQGSVMVRVDLAALLLPRIRSRDFFFSTEVIFLAEKLGEVVVELPVDLEPALRASTVRPFKHGMAMLHQLAELAWREGRIR